MNEQTKEQLKNTSQKYVEEWEIRHSEIPHYLWHYTSIAGLKGILSGSKLWFSHAAFLNDSSELSYAVDVAVKTTQARLENENEALVKEYLGNFLLKIQADRTNQQIFGFTTPVFIACCCREGDSLHLWRAYTGNGRGYSIGFFPESILDNLKPLRINETVLVDHATGEVRTPTKIYRALLREVIYDPQEQEETLKNVIDAFCQIILNNKSEFPSGNLNNLPKMIFIQELATVFSHYLPCFKHPAFKEEKEWRYIYARSSEDVDEAQVANATIEYREAGGYLVPYLQANIGKTLTGAESGKAGDHVSRLPFEDIYSGPGLDSQLARASLNSFLLRIGYLGTLVNIQHSSVPLRNI